MTTTIAVVSGVREHESGSRAGWINTSQQIGGALRASRARDGRQLATDDLLASAGGGRPELTNA